MDNLKKDISKTCLILARKSIKYYLKNQMILPTPGDLPDFLIKSRGGVFVSIFEKNSNKLRGCIGTCKPTRKHIAEEIIYNSLSAAFEDQRFNSLTENELNNIYFEISLLGEVLRVQILEELDPKIFGIIITSNNGKQALLLPNIREIDNVEKQLSVIYKKANIDPTKEKINLFKFRVKKFAEK